MELIRTNRVENGTELLKRCGGHLVFRGSSALERGDLKIKGKDKTTIHFNGIDKTVEVILRTIISVNQLNVYGAAADICDELARDTSKISESTGKLVAQNDLETMVTPSELPTINSASSTNEKAHSNLLRECMQKITTLPDHSQLTKLCSNASLAKNCGKGQYFTTTDETELDI